MSNPSFSVTNHIIINPVMSMRADLLNDPKSPVGIGKKIWHGIESEIISRIVALFTSIFAAVDAFVHFFTGCFKAIALASKNVTWNADEVKEHFKSAAFFGAIALVGSIAAGVWPGVLKYFKRNPVPPSSNDANLTSNIPEKIRNLVNDVVSEKEQSPFKQLKDFWKTSNLSGKRWFVEAFNQDGKQIKKVRKELADIVYRPIVATSLSKKNIKWLNEKEIGNKVEGVFDKIDSLSKGFFFHATSEKALESILKTKRVEVRHEKLYRGAFVSTRPELSFGKCVLAFKRNIERLSTLEHGFTINQNTYWAGFSQDIPVSESTLAYIMLDSQSIDQKTALEALCEKWTGRKIEVILVNNTQSKIKDIESLNTGIPKEWPDEGEKVGVGILNAMKLALTAPVTVGVAAIAQVQRSSILTTHALGRQNRNRQLLAFG